jgi:hypothetical protein
VIRGMIILLGIASAGLAAPSLARPRPIILVSYQSR